MRRTRRNVSAAATLSVLLGVASLTLAPGASGTATAGAPPLEWAISAGGTEHDFGQDIATGPNGAVTVTGTFAGSITLGTGERAVVLTSAGSTDAFMARYAPDGGLVWAVSAGGGSTEAGFGVTVDGDGAATVIGGFSGTATFGTGADAVTLTPSSGRDVFIARYDSTGTLDWAVSAGGGAHTGQAVASGPDGSVTVTGRFGAGPAVFGTGTAAVSLTSAGDDDIFIARYDAQGALEWAVSAGGPGTDAGLGVAVDHDGAAMVTGHFKAVATFGAGSDATTLQSAWVTAFVARYDASGALDWVTSTVGTDSSSAVGIGVASAADGAAVVTGYFSETATFGTGADAVTLDSAGGTAAFVARYRGDGALDWAVATGAGSTATARGYSVATGPDGSITVLGYFNGAMAVGAGGASATFYSTSGNDVFVARYDANGSMLWATQSHGREVGHHTAGGVAVDRAGAVTITGSIDGDATFGTGTDATALYSAGERDIFVARYAAPVGAVDVTAPSVAINAPVDGATQLLNATVAVDYLCTDEVGGSGIASCLGTVPDGGLLDTTEVGPHVFAVAASDIAGNTADGSSSYDVVYGFSGYAAPIQEGTNVVTAGRKLALRFSVSDAAGLPVTGITEVHATAVRYPCGAEESGEPITEDVVGRPGLKDFGDGSYHFNFPTSRSWANSCRTVALELGDGLPRAVDIQFR